MLLPLKSESMLRALVLCPQSKKKEGGRKTLNHIDLPPPHTQSLHDAFPLCGETWQWVVQLLSRLKEKKNDRLWKLQFLRIKNKIKKNGRKVGKKSLQHSPVPYNASLLRGAAFTKTTCTLQSTIISPQSSAMCVFVCVCMYMDISMTLFTLHEIREGRREREKEMCCYWQRD